MRVATRDAFGGALVELAELYPEFVVLDAGVSAATRTAAFARSYPDRFFNCGISEQSMVSVAAGLAASGIPVVASSFAAFLVSRAFDQLRVQVSQPRLNVKVVGSHGGISVGEDGISAQAVEDLALMSSLDSISIIVPADARETKEALRAALSTPGPFYLRCSRFKSLDLGDRPPFRIGCATTLREGSDITLMAIGIMVEFALEAAERLSESSIEARVLNMASFRPLDEAAIECAATDTAGIVVAEEHLVQGGLGSTIAMTVAQKTPVRMQLVGLRDYGQSAPAQDLLARYRLTPGEVESAARRLLERYREARHP